MSSRIKMNRQKYLEIKDALKEYGRIELVKRLTGASNTTIRRVQRSKSYAGYKAIVESEHSGGRFANIPKYYMGVDLAAEGSDETVLYEAAVPSYVSEDSDFRGRYVSDSAVKQKRSFLDRFKFWK